MVSETFQMPGAILTQTRPDPSIAQEPIGRIGGSRGGPRVVVMPRNWPSAPAAGLGAAPQTGTLEGPRQLGDPDGGPGGGDGPEGGRRLVEGGAVLGVEDDGEAGRAAPAGERG